VGKVRERVVGEVAERGATMRGAGRTGGGRMKGIKGVGVVAGKNRVDRDPVYQALPKNPGVRAFPRATELGVAKA